jgi:hypothetical protein
VALPEMRTMPTQVRRCSERGPFNAHVTLVSTLEASTQEARSIDVSLGGVSLICTEPLEVGQCITLIFHLATQSGMVAEEVCGRVMSARFDDDVAVLGIEFTSPLDRRTAPEFCRALAWS